MANAENKKGLVPVFIPKKDRTDDSAFVGLNGKFMQIKKGETVMVRPDVAELIENSRVQDEAAQRYIDENATDGQ